MKKNIFFEKVGKLTFSVILTGFTVTALVYAASSFTNGQVLDAWDLNNAFDTKLSITAVPTCWAEEYLTTDSSWFICKALTDNTLSQSDVLNTITSSCKICIAWSDDHLWLSDSVYNKDQRYSCKSLGSISRFVVCQWRTSSGRSGSQCCACDKTLHCYLQ